MATLGEVLTFLAPDREYHGYGPDYEDIIWLDGSAPFTKEQFLAAFDQVDAMKQEAKAAAEAKLQALGLTAEDIKALLS
jgi:gentisate 1,2-dioxygenase